MFLKILWVEVACQLFIIPVPLDRDVWDEACKNVLNSLA